MGKIKIVTGRGGKIIHQNTNGNHFIQLQQTVVHIQDTGFVRSSHRNFLVKGNLSDLQALEWDKDTQLEGNIVVEESLKPFNEKSPEYDLKFAGDTGVVCTLDGSPIYRRTIWDPYGELADTLVKHNNQEEIIQASSNQSMAITPNEAPEDSFDEGNHEDNVDEGLAELSVEPEIEVTANELEEIEIDDTFEL